MLHERIRQPSNATLKYHRIKSLACALCPVDTRSIASATANTITPRDLRFVIVKRPQSRVILLSPSRTRTEKQLHPIKPHQPSRVPLTPSFASSISKPPELPATHQIPPVFRG